MKIIIKDKFAKFGEKDLADLFEKAIVNSVELDMEPPKLNLLNGKFVYGVIDKSKKEKLKGYLAERRIKLELFEREDSPIKSIKISLIGRDNQAASSFVMPIVYWLILARYLSQFLGDVERELSRRGEKPSRFKLKEGKDKFKNLRKILENKKRD